MRASAVFVSPRCDRRAARAQADAGVVRAACRQNGRALWFASPELRADYETVITAVQYNAASRTLHLMVRYI